MNASWTNSLLLISLILIKKIQNILIKVTIETLHGQYIWSVPLIANNEIPNISFKPHSQLFIIGLKKIILSKLIDLNML